MSNLATNNFLLYKNEAEDKYEQFHNNRLNQEQQQLGDIDKEIKKIK